MQTFRTTPTIPAAERLARTFAWTCRLVGVLALASVVARAVSAPGSWAFLPTTLHALMFVLAATFLVFAAAVRMRIAPRAWRVLGAGLAVFVAMAVAGFELGKATHDAQMRQFFLSSGFPAWFTYAVMAVEILALLGLCIERTRARSACALIVVMIGAMATHVSLGNFPGAALDAIGMCLLCAALLWCMARAALPSGAAHRD